MKKHSAPSTVVLISAGSVLLGCALFAGYLFAASRSNAPEPVQQFPAVPLALNPATLTARSAVLYDPTDGRILFAKDAHTPRPLASLTKLMSATVVLNSAQHALNTPVTLTQADIVPEGDAGDWGFKAGDTATLGDLLKIGLIASSNDAMAAAAASIGGGYLNKMNAAAAAMGLSHMYFFNPTGLDVTATTSGGYGSAADMAKLAAAFLKKYPQFFELTTKPGIAIQTSAGRVAANATMRPLQDIPGFIGAKTGYTDLAGGNLVAAFDLEIGHPLIAVVLDSTVDGRFADVKTLINAARAQAAAPAASSTTTI